MPLRRRKKILNQTMTTTIDSLSHDGRGVAHVNGKTTFIQNALPGEHVIFKYTNSRYGFDEGETIDIITASDERIDPKEDHYCFCGGCSLKHLSHVAQVKHKQDVLLEQLQHFGNVAPKEVATPICGPITGYRHKARLGVRYVHKKDSVLVGFRERNGRFITEIDECDILHPSIGKKIYCLRDLILSLTNKDLIPQIEVAIDENTASLIIRHLGELPDSDIEKLTDFGKKEYFDIYLQPKGIDSIHKIWPKDGKDRLTYHLSDHNLSFDFHPTDFTQVNPHINKKMVTQAIDWLSPKKEDHLLDLFCGLGNFSLALARYSNHVIGVEGEQRMVDRGYENAKKNNISNVDFFATNLAKSFGHHEWAKKQYHKILLDPPRSGAQEIIAHIPKWGADTILYVSCNPATLARDAGLLQQQGFSLSKVGILDMFPNTSHVETMALFEKD